MKQAAPLQFRHHVFDEIGIGAGHVGCRDDKAVAATADEHFLQFVGEFLWSADHRIPGLAAARKRDEIARARVGLA